MFKTNHRFGIILMSLLAKNMTTIAADQEMDDSKSFASVVYECNNTYPVPRDLINSSTMESMITILKSSKNGKCFMHCFLNKMDVVDIKGVTKRTNLLNSISVLIQNMSDEWKQQIQVTMEEIRNNVQKIILHCEDAETVTNEKDACEKVYKFMNCYKDIELEKHQSK